MAKAITFLVLLIIFPAVFAATINVGGNSGWNTGFNYDTWAKSQTFTTQDVLLFRYGFTHSVYEVNQGDYQSCSSDSPINTYSTSPTSIPLTTTGTRYFICPTSNHCAQGMKLAVTVTASGSSGTPPPSPSTPGTPSPPSSNTPSSPPSGSPPGTTTPAPPPPPAGAATIILARWNSLFVGLSIGLAAFIGLMG